jgi:hypothetical protein
MTSGLNIKMFSRSDPWGSSAGRLRAACIVRISLGLVLLSWLSFCGLLGAWASFSSRSLAGAAAFGGSAIFLFVLAGCVVRMFVWPPVRIPPSPGNGSPPGIPPEKPPLAGAPVPVPVRPVPRLVRSAAEPLPIARDQDVGMLEPHDQPVEHRGSRLAASQIRPSVGTLWVLLNI